MRGDSSAGLAAPLDRRLGRLVVGTARAYLRLHRIPRSAERFITGRLSSWIDRILRPARKRPVKAFLSLSCRSKKIRVALRVRSAAAPRLPPPSMAGGSPQAVQTRSRAGKSGASLTFVTRDADRD